MPANLVYPPGKPRAIVHLLIQDPNLLSAYASDEDHKKAYLRFEMLKRILHLFDHAFNDRCVCTNLCAPRTSSLQACYPGSRVYAKNLGWKYECKRCKS